MAILRRVGGADVRIDELNRGLRANHAATQHQDIHIVMLHALMRRVHIMAKTSPDSLQLVCRHRSADS